MVDPGIAPHEGEWVFQRGPDKFLGSGLDERLKARGNQNRDRDRQADFDVLHSRVMDHAAVPCAFDLLMLDGEDLRRRPLAERKAALRKALRRTKGGIQYVDHLKGDGDEIFKAVCKLGLEGIVSKRIAAPYRSGPSKSWLKTKNPKAPAAVRVIEGGF
ncbi:MAG: hypothetical protein ACM3IH_17970 [Sphingobacteriales bacterium]